MSPVIAALLDIERPVPGPRTVAVTLADGQLLAVCGEAEAVFDGLTPEEEERARAELARVEAYELGRVG